MDLPASRSLPTLPSQFGPVQNATSKSRRAWLLGLIALTAMILLGLVVYPLDLVLSKWICGLAELPGDLRRILALGELVAHGSGVLILLFITWRLVPHVRFYLPRVACCALGAGLTANALKLVHARYRPLTCPPDIETVERTWRGWFPGSMDSLSQPYGYVYQSFPSAHTATAVGFAIGLAWLFPRSRILFFVFAAVAGLQRVAFQAHWPSDVMFGAAVGILLGCCFTLQGTVGNALLARFERFWISAVNSPVESTGDSSADELIEPHRRAA